MAQHSWLGQRSASLITAPELHAWLLAHARPGNPHHELVTSAIDDYAHETGDAELPCAHFREWLAEWGRETRQRQTGLLLVSAHGAKGLEFDHVVVLDGDWSERPDSRRLYYVAMTRARQTLTLARLDAVRHPFLDTLSDGPHLLRRDPVELPTPLPELARIYSRPELEHINLGYAGRLPPESANHGAITALQPGSPLQLARQGETCLLDAHQLCVGKMARSFSPPEGLRCVRTEVAAIFVRTRDDEDPAYGTPRCNRWEVVVPEFVWEPAPH